LATCSRNRAIADDMLFVRAVQAFERQGTAGRLRCCRAVLIAAPPANIKRN